MQGTRHNPSRQIYNAIQDKDLDRLKGLIKSPVDANRMITFEENSNEYIYTPISLAIHNGATKIVKFMLQSGASITGKSSRIDGRNRLVMRFEPLFQACEDGKWDIVDLLLEAGADPNSFVYNICLEEEEDDDIYGAWRLSNVQNVTHNAHITYFDYAIRKNSQKLLSLLIKHGLDFSKHTDKNMFAFLQILNKPELLVMILGAGHYQILHIYPILAFDCLLELDLDYGVIFEEVKLLHGAGFRFVTNKSTFCITDIKEKLADSPNRFSLDDDSILRLATFIDNLQKAPLTLTEKCRIVIRKCIGTKNIRENVYKLPVPESLKEFLTFDNVFSSDGS